MSGTVKKELKFWAGLLVIVLFCLMAHSARAAEIPYRSISNPDAVFYEANRLYAKDQFAAAAEKYQELAGSGFRSGQLYYNLGNAYFKLGQKGQAVLYYEKARRLIPGDADLKANLSYIGASNPWIQGVHGLGYLFSPDITLINASLWFFCLLALLCGAILVPEKVRLAEAKHWKPWFRNICYVLCCLVAISFLLAGITFYEQGQPQAVVIHAGSSARFEPSVTGTVYYPLTEGNVIEVIEKRGHWVLIRRADGKRGWVLAKEIAAI